MSAKKILTDERAQMWGEAEGWGKKIINHTKVDGLLSNRWICIGEEGH